MLRGVRRFAARGHPGECYEMGPPHHDAWQMQNRVAQVPAAQAAALRETLQRMRACEGQGALAEGGGGCRLPSYELRLRVTERVLDRPPHWAPSPARHALSRNAACRAKERRPWRLPFFLNITRNPKPRETH